MFKEYLLIYFLGHILGDYYFQSEELAEEKNKKMKKLMQHNCIYLISCIIIILPVFSLRILLSAVAVSLMHAAVDMAKYFYLKYFVKQDIPVRRVYIWDQAIHIICLITAACVMASDKQHISSVFILNNFMDAINIGKMKFLSWIVMLLFIFKPANITIKQLLSGYKPVNETVKQLLSAGKIVENTSYTEKDDKRTGGFIGSLERLIILIFLAMNQFSAIGLVLTAKSVARYNKIAEDKDFAEYYLIGTLLSTVLVIIVFTLVN